MRLSLCNPCREEGEVSPNSRPPVLPRPGVQRGEHFDGIKCLVGFTLVGILTCRFEVFLD